MNKVTFWYLDQYSCVTIQRNPKWFASVFDEINQYWNDVIFYREQYKTNPDVFKNLAAKKEMDKNVLKASKSASKPAPKSASKKTASKIPINDSDECVINEDIDFG